MTVRSHFAVIIAVLTGVGTISVLAPPGWPFTEDGAREQRGMRGLVTVFVGEAIESHFRLTPVIFVAPPDKLLVPCRLSTTFTDTLSFSSIIWKVFCTPFSTIRSFVSRLPPPIFSEDFLRRALLHADHSHIPNIWTLCVCASWIIGYKSFWESPPNYIPSITMGATQKKRMWRLGSRNDVERNALRISFIIWQTHHR